MVSDGQSKIRCIQWLRGIAASAVLVRHFASTADKHGIHVPWLGHHDVGGWGVDLFFVISGFIMVLVTAQHSGSFGETLSFWKSRIVRIVPLYWIITTFVVVLALLFPGATEYRISGLHVLASYFFVPMKDVRGVAAPVLGVGWTLNFEAYFYLAFGLLLLAPRRFLLPATVAWAIVSASAGVLVEPTGAGSTMLLSSLLVEFACGVLVGSAWLRGMALPRSLAAGLVILGFGAILITDVFGADLHKLVKHGIPALMIVSGGVALEFRKAFAFSWAAPMLLGEWSYSLYLIHVPVLAGVGKAVHKLSLTSYLPWAVLMPCVLAIAIVAAAVVHRFIERPLGALFARVLGDPALSHSLLNHCPSDGSSGVDATPP